MATKKKMLQAAAGNATGGAGLDITEVFSTYLYEGNSGTLSVNNGIDFSGEGGLVWIKNREAAFNHLLIDTARGGNKYLYADNAAAQGSLSSAEQFTLSSTGFSSTAADFNWNNSNYDYASWTFRKAPKFFDVVTWTGDGVAGRTIPHNLGTTVGTIIIKDLTTPWDWQVYHRSVTGYGALNNTDAWSSYTGLWNSQTPTDTEFYLGSDATVNSNGSQYVAYLFAHNNGDGEFGPDGDQDIIKCGSYTGNGAADGPEIDLGFEPQWVMIKRTDTIIADSWIIHDTMRGIASGGADPYLLASSSASENSISVIDVTPTGFKLTAGYGGWDASGGNYIYMAIRRGPLAQPESATEVFAPALTNSGSIPNYNTGFVTDFGMQKQQTTGAWYNFSRLTGTGYMGSDRTDAENSSATTTWDFMDGFGSGSSNTYKGWMWKRAPGFCDVVAYTGDGVAGRTVSHNLGVAPEMMWVKRRDSSGYDWNVYVSNQSNVGYLNSANGFIYSQIVTATADSSFTLNNDIQGNASGGTYIAYLFATLPGVSKVGSFSHTDGTPTDVDCGFTNGARFVLWKKTTSSGPWLVVDTTRGIVSGNDPYLLLNTTDAENSSYDVIDPLSSGFTVAPVISGGTYIFYAIA